MLSRQALYSLSPACSREQRASESVSVSRMQTETRGLATHHADHRAQLTPPLHVARNGVVFNVLRPEAAERREMVTSNHKSFSNFLFAPIFRSPPCPR